MVERARMNRKTGDECLIGAGERISFFFFFLLLWEPVGVEKKKPE